MPTVPRYQPYPTPTPAQAAHFRTIGEQWKLIQQWRTHPEIRELHITLQEACSAPWQPTEFEARWTRETLIFAISELQAVSAASA